MLSQASLKAVKEWNSDFNRTVISNPDFKRAKAFGNSERFLLSPVSLEISGNTVRKIGLYPYETDKGRGATVNRTGELMPAIYQWLSLKKYGLNWKTDKERRSLAFAITRKIGREGTYRRKNPTDIFGSSLKKTLPALEKKLAAIAVNEILYAI